MPGWVDLCGWLHTEINVPHRELNPDTVTHPSTNRARRRLTSLIETNALPLYARLPRQTQYQYSGWRCFCCVPLRSEKPRSHKQSNSLAFLVSCYRNLINTNHCCLHPYFIFWKKNTIRGCMRQWLYVLPSASLLLLRYILREQKSCRENRRQQPKRNIPSKEKLSALWQDSSFSRGSG